MFILTIVFCQCSALRLSCLYALCKALTDLDEDPIEAKLIALSTYEIGTNHSNPLNDVSIDILQKLRDEFLMVQLPGTDTTDDDESGTNDRSSVSNASKTDAKGDRRKASRPKSAHASTTAAGDDSKHAKTGTAKPKKVLSFSTYNNSDNNSTASKYVSTSASLNNKNNANNAMSAAALASSIPSSISREMNELIVSIKRGIFLSEPIPLEDITSAQDIFTACDHMFRVYIRGNALAGLQMTGSEVSLDNRSIALHRFLLEGPFMSWRGFVSVLTDFRVVSVHDVIIPSGERVDGEAESCDVTYA
jgi:hypothetical protein